MSWSGPVAGAAPYQTPPYANGQPGYGQQPPYQYGQQPAYGQSQPGPFHPGPPQRPQDSRPPKKKGNPVITRYPPPPGYRGPAQPQGPFHSHQHPAHFQSPPQSGFPQLPPAHSTYPKQGYNFVPPQGYAHRRFGPPQAASYPPSQSQAHNHQWPQQPYQPGQSNPQASALSSSQSYGAPQTSHQPYPAHTAAVDPTRQAFNQIPGWPQAPAQPTYHSRSQYSGHSGPVAVQYATVDSNATVTPTSAHPGTAPSALPNLSASVSHDNATDQRPELYLAWDDWDFDFDGAIWPKSNEAVDPNLSLGVIIWHPAKQVTRALPATFEEAEDQSLKPTPEKLGNGESVSMYFTAENSHEAFLDVRQTDDWESIKDDPAFVIFGDEEMRVNLVPIEECIAQRDRSDESVGWGATSEDAEMREANWSVMDNLEQALSASGEESDPTIPAREPPSAGPQTQEDILASLGVTGLPKPVSAELVPFAMSAQNSGSPVPLSENPGASSKSAFASRLQPEPLRSQSQGSTSARTRHPLPQRSYESTSSSMVRPLPPPPPPESDRYDPWNPSDRHQQYHISSFNGGRGSPARSEASNGTAAGSDFEVERPTETDSISLTPGSKFERTESSASRKRSYGDTSADDDRLRELDDHTKRKRRSLFDAAYGRR